MKSFVVFSFCVCFAALMVASAEECEYTMEKMCQVLAPDAIYRVRGCWYSCRIKTEFEVFAGTITNGLPCKSILKNTDGVCHHGVCWPNESK